MTWADWTVLAVYAVSAVLLSGLMIRESWEDRRWRAERREAFRQTDDEGDVR